MSSRSNRGWEPQRPALTSKSSSAVAFRYSIGWPRTPHSRRSEFLSYPCSKFLVGTGVSPMIEQTGWDTLVAAALADARQRRCQRAADRATQRAAVRTEFAEA